MAHDTQKIRVAISGGGLAGASLFHGLLKQPHVDVHIFESAPAFKEAGAAVSLAKNSSSALNLIGPSALRCLERAGAVPSQGAHLLLAQGPDNGKTVVRVGGDANCVHIVHRAAFLKELLVDSPQERMHASKKLTKIEQTGPSGPVTIHFADGTTHECDILIGADGIHSRVRKYILGESDPAASPVPAGWWAVQTLRPYPEVSAFISKDYLNVDAPREVGWIGQGALIFHNILSEGNVAQFTIVASCSKQDAPENWVRNIDADEIRGHFKEWPANFSEAVEKLVCDQPQQMALYFWEHLPARTFVEGAVAMTGDAAHSTTPWQGAGAGQSIEDSMILTALFGRSKTPAEARAALQVFDAVRRERSQQVVTSSKGTGDIVTAQDAETGLDAAKCEAKLEHRWDFLLDFDVEGHRNDALRQLEDKLKAA